MKQLSTKNQFQKYQQIYQESAEWNSIEYKLQLNMGNTNVKLRKVYCVFNPYMVDQFQKQNKGSTVYETYQKAGQFIGNNRLERVCQKGFQFTAQKLGLQFTIGQIELELEKDDTIYEMLMSKMCPRRTYPCNLSEQTQKNSFQVPSGFDSLYFRENSEDRLNTYRHRFKIFNKMQILPYYVLQFIVQNSDQGHIKKITCESCQDQLATIYCQTESIYLCLKCDYKQHKQKLSSQHVRKQIGDKPIVNFGFCKAHNNAKNELFCKICNKSMCMSCKVYGDHSHNVMMEHQLQTIVDLYNITTTLMKEMEPNLSKRKDQLQELLTNLNNQMKQLSRNINQIKRQLTVMFEKSMKSIDTLASRKMAYILADELQIKRQYDYIQWIQSFLSYQYNLLNPDQFLISWTKHEKLRKDILNLGTMPFITQIKTNFKLLAEVMIEQDGTLFQAASNINNQGNVDQGFGNIKMKVHEITKKKDIDPAQQLNKDSIQFRNLLFNEKKT